MESFACNEAILDVLRRRARLPPPPKSPLVHIYRPAGSERLATTVVPDTSQQHAPNLKENSVHILKRLERYVSALFKLGRTERLAKSAYRTSQDIASRIEVHFAKIDQVAEEQNAWMQERLAEQNAWMQGRLAEQSLNDSELSRRLDLLFLNRPPVSASQEAHPEPETAQETVPDGFQLFMNNFYNRLENRFRGSREDILNRLRVYQPDVEAAAIRTDGKPVLDLGCGRGEWLQLMREMGIKASGVDQNAARIAEARDAGLNVQVMEARLALQAAKDDSLSVVSAHHLVEHISFTDVAWIAREALRVLAPGGLLIFEIPNPRNMLVGATSFHNHSTHLRLLTDPVLGVLFETAGYDPVETRFLHPHERLDEFLTRPGFDPELANLLFGAEDLAIIGQKPSGAS